MNTVDIAIVYHTKLLFIARTKPPFMDKIVLPGGHVEMGETLEEAAVRELSEEVGLTIDQHRLRFLTVLDAADRDPRGHKVSTVFTVEISESELASCQAGSDARSMILRNIADVTAEEVGFDHFEAVRMLQERV
jgi:8-oxo-dGTP diphosphatase